MGAGDLLTPRRHIVGEFYLSRGADDNQVYLFYGDGSGGDAISSIGWTHAYIILKKFNSQGLYRWAVIRVRDRGELGGRELEATQQELLRTVRIMGPEEAWQAAGQR
jgi:hypothetical protein